MLRSLAAMLAESAARHAAANTLYRRWTSTHIGCGGGAAAAAAAETVAKPGASSPPSSPTQQPTSSSSPLHHPMQNELGQFGDTEYWDDFYAKKAAAASTPRARADGGEGFEWFLEPRDVIKLCKYVLPPHTGSALAALDLGCGTSGVAFALAEAGVPAVVGVDGSTTAIAQMQRAHHTDDDTCLIQKRLLFRVANLCSPLPFLDNQFDLIIDKGTTDAIMYGAGDAAVASLHQELRRVITKDGIVMHFSDEDPDLRLPLLQAAGWRCSVRELDDDEGETVGYYMYQLRQKPVLCA